MNYAIIFIYGLLAASASIFLESFFILILFPEKNFFNGNLSPVSNELILMVVLAVSIEELLKLIFIRKIYLSLEAKRKIILSAFLLGAGFSLVELTLNLFRENFLLNIFNWYLWGAVLIHIFTSMTIGFLFLEKNSSKYWFLAIIFAMAFAIHLAYNFLVLFLFK